MAVWRKLFCCRRRASKLRSYRHAAGDASQAWPDRYQQVSVFTDGALASAT
jgi:hypothetical protein